MATNKKIKAPALLSEKIGKYECFTGEGTLPSGPSHIILQAEFTYSFLWKSFQKQKKTKDKWSTWRKKAIEKQREKKLASPNLYASKKDILLFLTQKEVFNELYYEIFDGIDKLNKEIDYDN